MQESMRQEVYSEVNRQCNSVQVENGQYDHVLPEMGRAPRVWLVSLWRSAGFGVDGSLSVWQPVAKPMAD